MSVFSQPEVIVPSSLRELTFFLNKEMTSEILVETLQILRSVEKQQQRIPRSSSSSSNVSFSPCGLWNWTVSLKITFDVATSLNLRCIISILSTFGTRRTFQTCHVTSCVPGSSCLADKSIGDIVTHWLSHGDTTTEWPKRLLTLEPLDQSYKKKWPDRKIPIYVSIENTHNEQS